MSGALVAWLVTVLVEVPIVAAVFKGQRARMAVVCLVATSLTNLPMNLVLPLWLGTGRTFLLVGEGLALGLEFLAYWWLSNPRDWPRAAIASGLANSASFGIGLVLFG